MQTFQYPVNVHSYKKCQYGHLLCLTLQLFLQPVTFHHTDILHTCTTNCMMQYEIILNRFPEKPHEQPELSPIGCHPRSISQVPHFADLIHSMETVCMVTDCKAKSTAALVQV